MDKTTEDLICLNAEMLSFLEIVICNEKHSLERGKHIYMKHLFMHKFQEALKDKDIEYLNIDIKSDIPSIEIKSDIFILDNYLKETSLKGGSKNETIEQKLKRILNAALG